MTTLYLIGLVGALGAFAVWLGFRYARKSGAAQARADGLEAGAGAARKGQEIDEAVSKLSDSDLDDELRRAGRK